MLIGLPVPTNVRLQSKIDVIASEILDIYAIIQVLSMLTQGREGKSQDTRKLANTGEECIQKDTLIKLL